MNNQPPSSIPIIIRRSRRAFSLIEITLALGIVTFALVGVIGVLPVALATSRQSIDKNRAAAIASTLYTSFRSQPFQKVYYLTTQSMADGTPNAAANTQPLDLNAQNTASTAVTFYATFLDVSTPSGDASDTFGRQRHLCFTSGKSGGGADYLVTMHFNNRPDGTVITPVPAASNGIPSVPAQANQVELIISPIGRPADQYHFISTIANRTN